MAHRTVKDEIIIAQLKERGYAVTGIRRVKGRIRIDYVCDQGHSTEMDWGNFRKGQRCGFCTNRLKKDISFVSEQFKARGFTLLSTEYVDSRSKLRYICSNGHESEIRWGEFQQGSGCIKCRIDAQRFNINTVKEAFASEGYTLLTELYVNAHSMLRFLCPNGHEGKTNWDRFKQGKRCPKCFRERMQGETHPQWNPNLTERDRILRRSNPENRRWRVQVFERDDYTCRICNTRGRRLQAHHLECYANNEELRYDVENGVTLCFECHSNHSPIGFHRVFGTRNNTRAQYEEYVRMRKEGLIAPE